MQSQIDSQKRTFDYYLNFFGQMLGTESNLIIFGDKQLEIFVHEHRNRSNTLFINKEIDWFK